MRVSVSDQNLMCSTCGERVHGGGAWSKCPHTVFDGCYVEVPDPAPAQPQTPVPQAQWEHTYLPLMECTFEALLVGLDEGAEIILGPLLIDGLNYVVLRRPRRNDATQGEGDSP